MERDEPLFLEECQDLSFWHFGSQEGKLGEGDPLGILLTNERSDLTARGAADNSAMGSYLAVPAPRDRNSHYGGPGGILRAVSHLTPTTGLHTKSRSPACFCKCSFMGTQPPPFISMSSVAAFPL